MQSEHFPCLSVELLHVNNSPSSRGGGGYLSTVRGTRTCHFLGVLFSNRDGIMGIVFTIFRHFMELWVSFSGDF